MSAKSLVMLCMTLGSIIGGYLPAFFGINTLSFTSVLTSGLGGIIGIIFGYNLSKDL